MGNKDVIYTAGGILWKKVSGEYKIGLVCRKSFGEKWTLPQGQLKENESWEAAALREIEEEVGVKAKIIKYADTINYKAGETPKVVIYYHMQIAGESMTLLDSDIIRSEWYTPREALDLLAYEEEKELVKGIQFPGSDFMENIRKFSRQFGPVHYIRHLNTKSRAERLEGELKTTRVELDYAIKKAAGKDESPAWGVHAMELLDKAEIEMRNNNLDLGWKKLHAAGRLSIYGMTDGELAGKADTIRIEAEKLNEWRKSAIYKLLGDPDHPLADLNADSLARAARIRDEFYGNEYYKNRLTQDVFSVLLFTMVVSTVGIVLYFFLTDIENLIIHNDAGRSVSTLGMVVGVLLFGLLGGSISSLFHIRDSSVNTRIPEIISHNFVTVVRVIIGGGSALVIFIFLESELSGLILQDIDLKPANPFTYFAFAFVAGFTERLLLKAVSSITGRG
jgi:ADP-ribose pyrophosphatase YjhB (NUDIX family)